jgi:hypothetical protein
MDYLRFAQMLLNGGVLEGNGFGLWSAVRTHTGLAPMGGTVGD